MITLETAQRIISLNQAVKALRGDLAEIDSGTIGIVTIKARYSKSIAGSYRDASFEREMKLDGNDARRISDLIRRKKQDRLNACLRELRQLDGEIANG